MCHIVIQFLRFKDGQIRENEQEIKAVLKDKNSIKVRTRLRPRQAFLQGESVLNVWAGSKWVHWIQRDVCVKGEDKAVFSEQTKPRYGDTRVVCCADVGEQTTFIPGRRVTDHRLPRGISYITTSVKWKQSAELETLSAAILRKPLAHKPSLASIGCQAYGRPSVLKIRVYGARPQRVNKALVLQSASKRQKALRKSSLARQ
ncbi:hypothetical protein RRG08_056409 [Elysia crispata]|uniref:Uncharacterized protein n=1 Tax=Elysia crispata TaxID=231223 RepID=A0AAE0YZM4_9GAST|nr:hypothetical protein RRG08_056409 [Elysia crispata]